MNNAKIATANMNNAKIATAKMNTGPIVKVSPLGFPWQTVDPFLFCVYHDDAYPPGNELMGPAASLSGRDLGQDFAGKDGWRMYHGHTVPGFPAHPHRGFETVTIVRRGLIDHSDSLGATARFGGGDVQWLTAGRGIVHSEMFPLREREQANPLELFQIWLNLPAKDKMVAPHFTMFWSEDIPRTVFTDQHGGRCEVVCIAGRLQPANDSISSQSSQSSVAPLVALSPPPDSWASRAESQLAIWTMKLDPGARWSIPAASGSQARRSLYFFKGASIRVAGQSIDSASCVELDSGQSIELTNGADSSELLLLQGRPIAEPVAQYGPFVMNTREQLQQAFNDYQRTQFGGWPWPDDAPVHERERGRFAKHADGRVQSR